MSGIVNERRFRVCRDEKFASRFNVASVVTQDFPRNPRALCCIFLLLKNDLAVGMFSGNQRQQSHVVMSQRP